MLHSHAKSHGVLAYCCPGSVSSVATSSANILHTYYVCVRTCVQTGPRPPIQSNPIQFTPGRAGKKRAALETQRAACQVSSGGAGLGSLRRESTHSFPKLLASSCLYLTTITVHLPQRFSLYPLSFARLVVTHLDCTTRTVLHPPPTRPRTRRIPGRQSYTRSQSEPQSS